MLHVPLYFHENSDMANPIYIWMVVTIQHHFLPHSWLFSRYLNSVNASFLVFSRFFHECQNQKAHVIQCYQAKCPTMYSLNQFFEGLNFINLSNPRNSRNLSTSKNQLYSIQMPALLTSKMANFGCSRGYKIIFQILHKTLHMY